MTHAVKKRFATIEDFLKAVANIHETYSIRNNAAYVNISVISDIISGKHESTGEPFEIKLSELFEAQQKLDLISTTELKQFISTRDQSSAMAILKHLNII